MNVDPLETLERAKRLCNTGVFTVALQCRRLRTIEPEDETFIFRWWADLEFLIVALRRLRRAAELVAHVPESASAAKAAIKEFDRALPRNFKKMRDIAEHFDEYALDTSKRHHRDINRLQLEVGLWDGKVFQHLGDKLDVDASLNAAERLYEAIKAIIEQYGKDHPVSA